MINCNDFYMIDVEQKDLLDAEPEKSIATKDLVAVVLAVVGLFAVGLVVACHYSNQFEN